MGMLYNQILQFTVLIMMLSTKVLVKASHSLPGCPDKCGSITIPYPFGIRIGCYLSQEYYVDCKKLQIWQTDFKLLGISSDGHMRGLVPMGYRCYKNHVVTSSFEPRIKLSRFHISNKRNMLTAVGCDTRADIKTIRDGDREGYIIGCLSMTNCDPISNGSCLGMGCRQVPFPYRMTSFRIHAQSNTGKVGKWRYNNCTYAFLVENGNYTFYETDLYNMKNQSFPVIFEWWVGNMGCKEAQISNMGYICTENSVCQDIVFGSNRSLVGYHCQCAQGYQGNAYIPNGCKDINECDGLQNGCIHNCVNTNGGYNCSCPYGQQGDGWKNGSGCSYSQPTTSLGKSKSSGTKIQYQGIIMGIASSFVLTIILYCGLKQRKIMKSREFFFKKNGGLILQNLLFESKKSSNICKIFAARVLEKATNNFHKTHVIGQGGYGTVYKGTLEDKTTIAIKKSKSIDKNQIEQFINEVIILSEISHPNVVKLLGCCLETQTPLLVYEFVTNKTVFNHLHEKDYVSSMSFDKRLNIAIQTAEALAHIHSTTQLVHRDIKSSNILLTDDYTAKVSDFGISRFIPIDQTHVQTLVHGTLGYIDPEYFRSGILTEKSDVYSFGMVLVELLTGRKVFSHNGTESDLGLAMSFVSSLEKGCLIQILDDNMKKYGLNEHIKYIAKLAKDCVELEGKKRPSMDRVRKELKELRQSYLNGYIIFKRIEPVNANQLILFDG